MRGEEENRGYKGEACRLSVGPCDSESIGRRMTVSLGAVLLLKQVFANIIDVQQNACATKQVRTP